MVGNRASATPLRLVVVAILAATVASSCSALADVMSPEVADLEEGDCFSLDELPKEIGNVRRTPCLSRDAAEVTGWVEIPDDGEYPGAAWFNGVLVNWCSREFEEANTGLDASYYTIGWMYPTLESWDDGDRAALCYSARS